MLDEVYGVEVAIFPQMREEQIQQAVRMARRQMVDGLLEQLHNRRIYAIELREEWPQSWELLESELREDRYGQTGGAVFRLTAHVSEVERRPYEIPVFRDDYIGFVGDWPPLPSPLWKRAASRISKLPVSFTAAEPTGSSMLLGTETIAAR